MIYTLKQTIFVQTKNIMKEKEQNEYDIHLFWVAVSILAIFMISYLLIINAVAGASYKIKSREKILSQLNGENLKIKENSAVLSSSKKLNELAKSLNLIESKNVSYIRFDNAAVGLNNKTFKIE